MRPGQTAPVFRRARAPGAGGRGRFNEAGADCPGIPGSPPPTGAPRGCFNEAGADCPGIPAAPADIRHGDQKCFNEAGADCPGIPANKTGAGNVTMTLQ